MVSYDDIIGFDTAGFPEPRSKYKDRLNIKTVFPGMGITMLKIRRSQDRLIFNMGILMLVRWHHYIETAASSKPSNWLSQWWPNLPNMYYWPQPQWPYVYGLLKINFVNGMN